MEKFSRQELNTIAERLRAALSDLDMNIKVSEPDGVALILPGYLSTRSNEMLAELAMKALQASGIRVHLDLHVSFYQNEVAVNNYKFTVIVNGTPKSEFN